MHFEPLDISATQPLRRTKTSIPIAVPLVIFIVFLAHIATIRSGHFWGDDFAQYIQHAKNLATGKPFQETGYIYNPNAPEIGPRSYPPLFPVLLAPIYCIFGLNLTSMKVEGIVFFGAALLLVSLLFLARMSPACAVILMLIVAFNPYFFYTKDFIGSDYLFFLTMMASLYAIERSERGGWRDYKLAALVGSLIYFCYATRTIGIVLLPSLAAYLVLRDRMNGLRFFAVVCGMCFPLLLLQSFLFGSGASSYLDQIHFRLDLFSRNALGYTWEFRHRLWPFPGRLTSWTPTIAIICVAVAGYVHRLRTRISYLEVYSLAYTMAVILWTSEYDTRFLIPVLPLWIYYAAIGMERAVNGFSPVGRRMIYWLAVAMLAVSYGSAYANITQAPIPSGIGDPEFIEVSEYIRAHTAPDAVIVFRKPRLLALMTSRHVAAYHQGAEPAELIKFFSDISTRYVLISKHFASDIQYMQPLLEARRCSMIFQNGGFTIYEWR
jgi:hypothetical protein